MKRFLINKIALYILSYWGEMPNKDNIEMSLNRYGQQSCYLTKIDNKKYLFIRISDHFSRNSYCRYQIIIDKKSIRESINIACTAEVTLAVYKNFNEFKRKYCPILNKDDENRLIEIARKLYWQ